MASSSLGEGSSSEPLDPDAREKKMERFEELKLFLADDTKKNTSSATLKYLELAEIFLDKNEIDCAEDNSTSALELMRQYGCLGTQFEKAVCAVQGEICLHRSDIPGCLEKLMRMRIINKELKCDSDPEYNLLNGKFHLERGLIDVAESEFNRVLKEREGIMPHNPRIAKAIRRAEAELKKLEEQRREQLEKEKRERAEKRKQEEALKAEKKKQADARKKDAKRKNQGESQSIVTSATSAAVVTADVEKIPEDVGESQLIDTIVTADVEKIPEDVGECQLIDTKVEETSEKSSQFFDEGTRSIQDDYSEYEHKLSSFEYWEGGVTNTRSKLRKAYMMVKVLENFKFVKEQRHFSVLPMVDEDTADYQSIMFDNFGEMAVKVLFVNGCSVGLEKIEDDFISWYSSLINKIGGQSIESGQMQIEEAFRKFFRRIFKELPKLYPKYTHGNWIDGMANIDGEGRLFNMKYHARGHIEDLRVLHRLIEGVLLQIHPNHIDDFENMWNPSEIRDMSYYGKHCSIHVAEFMNRFSAFLDRQDGVFHLYRPLFWSGEERIRFLEGVHDILWMEVTSVKGRNRLLCRLQPCFLANWQWWTLVEIGSVFYKILHYKKIDRVTQSGGIEGVKIGTEVEVAVQPALLSKKAVDSIPFFRNVRHHYNEYSDVPKCIEDIEAEVDAKFDVCFNVFVAVCNFINLKDIKKPPAGTIQRFCELLSSLGCLPLGL